MDSQIISGLKILLLPTHRGSGRLVSVLEGGYNTRGEVANDFCHGFLGLRRKSCLGNIEWQDK